VDREAIQRQVAEFQRAYMTAPDFVDRRYEVPAVADLVAQPGVVGVARYVEFPSFEPERLFTLVYRPNAVEVSAAVGESSLWCSMPVVYQVVSTGKFEVEEGEPFEPGHAWRQSAVLALPSRDCPPLLRSWEAVRAAAAQAGNCSTDTCDGIVYRHRVADRSFHTVADWYNPDPPEHAPQLALIDAYVALLRRLSLYPG
jgi:hypothetical protein